MNLDQFMAQAPVALEAFAASTRHYEAIGAEGFGPEFMDRDWLDWWAEVQAYQEFVELSSQMKQN